MSRLLLPTRTDASSSLMDPIAGATHSLKKLWNRHRDHGKDGAVIGYLIPMGAPFEGTPRELQFIQRINRLLLYGA